jgi:hypothetical protein
MSNHGLLQDLHIEVGAHNEVWRAYVLRACEAPGSCALEMRKKGIQDCEGLRSSLLSKPYKLSRSRKDLVATSTRALFQHVERRGTWKYDTLSPTPMIIFAEATYCLLPRPFVDNSLLILTKRAVAILLSTTLYPSSEPKPLTNSLRPSFIVFGICVTCSLPRIRTHFEQLQSGPKHLHCSFSLRNRPELLTVWSSGSVCRVRLTDLPFPNG